MDHKVYSGIPRNIFNGEEREGFYNPMWVLSMAKVMNMAKENPTYHSLYMAMYDNYPHGTPNEIASMTNTFLIVNNCRDARKFVFSENMKEALINTNTPKSKPDIKLPFKGIIIDEWCFAEVDGIIRGVRFFDHNGEPQSDFVKIADEDDYQAIKKSYGQIINMVLYLTSEKPDLEKAIRKPQKVKGAKRTDKKYEVIYVGRHYKPLNTPEPSTGGKWTLTQQVTVRGHWKTIPTKLGYRRIFIQPYKKGLDMAEAIAKVYKVV